MIPNDVNDYFVENLRLSGADFKGYFASPTPYDIGQTLRVADSITKQWWNVVVIDCIHELNSEEFGNRYGIYVKG